MQRIKDLASSNSSEQCVGRAGKWWEQMSIIFIRATPWKREVVRCEKPVPALGCALLPPWQHTHTHAPHTPHRHTHTHTHTLRSFSDAAANSLTETCSKACWWSLFITVKSVRRWRRGYSRGLGRMAATSWGTARVWQESCACVSGGCDTWSVKRYVCHCKVYTHGLSFLFLRVWMCLSELKRYWL